MKYIRIKRILDIIIAFLGILFLSPLLIILIVLIKIGTNGSIIFKQKRFGQNKSYFYIYKFRTMKLDTPKDVPTHLLENPDQWYTEIGKFLRKTSMDELPQLFNILKGDMSFIGPRPALWNQYDLIELRDKYNSNRVPVGLTGWAQINGRDEISLEEKAKLDGEYANNIGFIMDLKCMLKTILHLI